MSTLSGLSHPLAKAIVNVANDEPVKNANGLVHALQRTGLIEVNSAEPMTKDAANDLVEDLANHVLDALPAATRSVIDTLPTKQATAVVNDLFRTTEKVVNNEVRQLINLPAILNEILDDARDTLPEIPNVPELPLPGVNPGVDPAEKAKLMLTGALADFPFTRQRNEFVPALDTASLSSKTEIDAGRLAHTLAEEAEADAGQNISSTKADEFDVFFKKRKQVDLDGASAMFAAIGQGAEIEFDLTGMSLTPSLAGGPSDGTAVDGAIAQFFAQLDAFGRDLIGTLSEPATMFWIIGLGAGMVSMELARRRVTRPKSTVHFDSTGWAPGLPLPGMN